MENDQTTKTKKINPDEEVHTVDGIVELNHPSPFWWKALYTISVIWGIGYGWYYLVGGGPSLREELTASLDRISEKKVVSTVSADDEKNELRVYYKDPKQLAAGLAVFNKNCVSCHSADGGGGIGPNLTDAHWINGDGSIDSILKIVREGVSEKGMPPWGPILKREDTLAAAAFVRSLRGKTPQKPKAPQGNPVDYKQDI